MTTYCHHHHHGLRLTSSKSKYMCDGCLMDGHGDRYHCNESCNYDLHKDCLNPKLTRTLDPFPGLTFEFHDRPPPCGSKGCCIACTPTTYCGSCRACDVCGETVEGFVYHCKKKDLDVHPQCANLKSVIRVEGVKFDLWKGVPDSKCNWCKRKKLGGSVKNIPGFCYVSSTGDCSFHVSCLMKIGIEFGSSSSSVGNCSKCSSGNDDDKIHRLGQELAVPELRLQKIKKPSQDRQWITKIGKAVGLFLKIVLSVIFGDPTMIMASLVVHLLSS